MVSAQLAVIRFSAFILNYVWVVIIIWCWLLTTDQEGEVKQEL